MPRSKNEAIIFTSLMCTMMVLGMSSYNLWLSLKQIPLPALISGFIPGFVVAFALDFILVGPLAKKIALKLPFNRQSPLQAIVAISLCMIILMVSCMTLYGLLYNRTPLTVATYCQGWLTNFIMALPLNLLVVGPVARWLLTHIQAHTSK